MDSFENQAYLDRREVEDIDRWWRAANYLSVGQIYLMTDPLLAEPLSPEHIKPRLLGHWGTTPGLNLLWAHANRLINQRDMNAIFLCGPGHGGPAAVANAWLEGTWSEVYPGVGRDLTGMEQLFRQFSFPGGIPSHVAAEVPGSIHEGGELGYVLSHAYGAVMDNPDLVAVAVVGDGEAETGPLAGSWHGNKFVDPVHDGAVLPVLHLNGYKIANPTVLARIPREELLSLMRGYGYDPLLVAGDDPADVHHQLARAMDTAHDRITAIQKLHRESGDDDPAAPHWPMIILATPKGWTGPAEVDGTQIEGTWRAHQLPLSGVRDNPQHLAQLEAWLRSYRPEELFDPDGAPVEDVRRLAPQGPRRMSANPHANGGQLRVPLRMDDFRDHAVDVPAPGAQLHEPTREFGRYLRHVVTENPHNFVLVGPDETASNRLDAVYEVTEKRFSGIILDTDENQAPSGRVVEMLSEHMCQGWLEGYLLTGRHGLFSCYEAFIHIVDSMVNQHAKWLKVTRELDWRQSIPSLNYLLSSHVWRQDHNGFSHQDPGFIDHVVNKKAEIVRVYLPPDTNTLLSTMEHCLRSTDYINVVVAGKQPTFDWLDPEQAALHCARGIGVWDFASNDDGDPDVVVTSAGDIPTQEALAAVSILRRELPDLRVRFVNVVDLMRLQDATEHPHGLPGPGFDTLFTTDKPIIFAYHGYPWLIHRLTYRRTNHANIHVRGYKEEGTTTTPFDMVMRNDLDRYHLVMDVIDRTPSLRTRAAGLRQRMMDARYEATRWTREHGEDMPEVSNWSWAESVENEDAAITGASDTAADF